MQRCSDALSAKLSMPAGLQERIKEEKALRNETHWDGCLINLASYSVQCGPCGGMQGHAL